MAQFGINWLNTLVTINPFAVGQRVSHRRKSLGGAFSSTGYTPANDLPKTANSSTSPNLGENIVWEFKVEAICQDGSIAANDNGLIEGLKFACLVPAITFTDTTSNILLNKLGLDITKVEFTLRLSSNDAIVYGPTIVNPIGNNLSLEATGLTADTEYYWQYKIYATVNSVEIVSTASNQINGFCGPYEFTTDENVPNLIWIAGTSTCEKAGGFGIVKTITGVYSPARTFYDSPTNRVYVGDHDSLSGNVYWFNQATATTAGDMTYSTQVDDRYMYGVEIDSDYRRIYFVGMNSGGLVVYDIPTDTVTTVPFGIDAAFSRIAIYIFGNTLLCNDRNVNLILINRATLTLTATIPISGIPNNSRFTDANSFTSNGTNIYVAAGSNGPAVTLGSIGVYNMNFSSNIANISLPGAATWDGSRYWQSIYYDPISTYLYVSDFGSSNRYTIDTATNTVIHTESFMNREGKLAATATWTTNPVTNDLFCAVTYRNNSSDPLVINATYKQNRTTQAFEFMYKDSFFANLNLVSGTDRVVGSSTGNVYWSGETDPDGSLTVLSLSTGTDNTGFKIVNTLVEVDANNGNAPTGEVKPNLPGDPNYIAPFEDNVTCPVGTSLTCPADKRITLDDTTLYYEFTVLNSVINNPVVDKIRISAFNTGTSSVEGTPVVVTGSLPTYLSGNIPGLTALADYYLRVEYLNSSDVVQATCNG